MCLCMYPTFWLMCLAANVNDMKVWQTKYKQNISECFKHETCCFINKFAYIFGTFIIGLFVDEVIEVIPL